MNNTKIKNIIKESIRRVLKENLDNSSWEELIDIIGYNYYEDEPEHILPDFQYMVDDVLTNAYNKKNKDTSLFDTDYPECNPENIGKYIEMMRTHVNNDFMQLYNQLKEKQVHANEILDNCTKQFVNFKQGKNPKI